MWRERPPVLTPTSANRHDNEHDNNRKAVRATLILIPLLGLHYMLTPFRPEAKSEWEVYYEIIAAVCTSFQGLCVAMLFCFCNGEVLNAIKKRLADSFLFNHDSKRTMRSRSNTAISNIFNSVVTTNNHNQQNNNNNNNSNSGNNNNNKAPNFNHQRRPIEATGISFRTTISSSSSSLSNCIGGNSMTSQLVQRQPLVNNSHSQHVGSNGHVASEELASQRTSVMTTVSEVSPLQEKRPHPVAGMSATTELATTIETKLTRPLPQAACRPLTDETLKLLGRQGETNNKEGGISAATTINNNDDKDNGATSNGLGTASSC
jgi:hypothetical protein